MVRLLLPCALLLAPSAWAEHFNQVDFTTEVVREVANDLLTAQLSADVSDRQSAQVAAQLNGIMNISLHKAEEFPQVHLTSGNQTTFPVYGKNNQLIGWRAHGDLRLETHDFKAASDLIARLQDGVQLSSLTFSISAEANRRIQNEMVIEAMTEFRRRAKVIVDAMNGHGYKILHLNIEQGFSAPPMLARAADAAAPAPDFSPGSSPLTIRISGSIEVHEH